MNKQLEFFSYCRASTDDQKITLKDQEDKIKSYCSYKNFKLIETYIDSGISGSINAKDRPEMKKLLERLQNGEGNGVIVSKLDRLSRNSKDVIVLMDYFNKNEIQLIILDPEIDTKSIFGKMMLTIMSGLAEMELNLIRSRTKDALKKKKENKEVYGQIPYGFDKTEDNKLIENKKEQDNIKRILELHNEGKNTKQISDKFNNDLIERKEGKCKWYPEQIKRILKSVGIEKEKTKLKRKKL